MTSCAITDHGWMAGVIDFYKACKKEGIKPLLGVEAYITEDEDGKEYDRNRDNMHMVLIAKDKIGYSKLLKLCTEAALDNFYYKPRIYKPKLRALQGHVIATSACLGGILAKKLHFKRDNYGRATEAVDENGLIRQELEYYLDVFDKDFFLELQVWDSGDHFQPVFNKFLLDTGKDMNLPFVLTADAHYLTKEDTALHELLMAMQMKLTVEEYKNSGDMLYGPHFYVASSDTMLARAKSINCEEAYYNTQEIANRCNVEIELGKYKEPTFNIEDVEDYDEFVIWKKRRGNNQIECMRHSHVS